jgi:hypothetical protein
MTDLSKKIRSILHKHDVLKEARINNNSLDAFVDSMLLDIQYESHNVRRIPFMSSHFILKIFIVFFGVIYSNFLYLIKIQNKLKLDFSNVKYIFLPFSDSHFIRFKHIPSILEKDYAMIYPPAFHIDGIIKHLSFFSKRKTPVLTPDFGFKNALIFLYHSIKKTYKITNVSKELAKEISYEAKNSFQLGIMMSILNQLYIERFLKSISKANNNKIIWFFDFDKDYKYIAFNSEIKKTRKDDLTVHIQHGLFWGNDLCYVSPNVDYIFCCNNRERNIILSTISDPKRVLVMGVPFQAFDNMHDKKVENESTNYDYLILLSSSFDDKAFKIQCEILSYFKSQESFSYVVRLRPMSKDNDIEKFDSFLDNNCITSNTTLSQDIDKARSIVSFSEDSLIECFRKKKPTLFGNPFNLKFIDDHRSSDIPFNVFNNISEFEKLITNRNLNYHYDFNEDIYIKDNFGEFDFEKMKINFLNNINIIY